MISSITSTVSNSYYSEVDNFVSNMVRSARRGPWLPEEDQALLQLVRTQGANNWVRISQQLQHRSPKQCRERYHQNLKPSLKHDPISAQEGEMIERLVHEMGKRWAEIARRLGNRSDNAVKNWWNGSVNRRRRNPAPATTGFKQVGSRLQPIPFTRSLEHHYSQNTQTSYEVMNGEVSALYGPQRSVARPHRPADLQMPSPVDTRNPSTASTSPRLPSDSCAPAFVQSAPPTAQLNASFTTRPPLSRNSTSETRPALPPLRHPSIYQHNPARRNSTYERPPISPALSDISQRQAPSLISDNQSMYSISPRTVTTPRPGIPAPMEIGKPAWLDRSTQMTGPSTMQKTESFPCSYSSYDVDHSGSNTHSLHTSTDSNLYKKHSQTLPPPQIPSLFADERSRDSRMNVSRLLE